MPLDDISAMEKTLDKEGFNAEIEYNAMMAEFSGNENASETSDQAGTGEEKTEKGDIQTATTEEGDTELNRESENSDDSNKSLSDADAENSAKKGKADAEKTALAAKNLATTPTYEDALYARMRKAEGKLGEMNMRVQSLTDELKKGHADKETKEKLDKLEKVISKYKEEDPDGQAAMEASSAKAIEELRAEFDKKGYVSQAQVKELIERQAKEMFSRQQYSVLDKKHKDWQATVRTGDFHRWLSVQSTDLQALADSDYADDAIQLIDRYKAHQEEANEARTQADANLAEKAAKQKQLNDAVPPTQGREKASKRTMTEFEAMMAEFSS